MARSLVVTIGIFILLGTALFFSCGSPDYSSFTYSAAGTSVNNPMAGQQILAAICNKLVQGHAGLSFQTCTMGVESTSFGSALGVPPGVLDPFSQLLTAEQTNLAVGNFDPMNVCVSDINTLDPNSQPVQAAYNPASHNAFEFVIDMIPQGPGSCANVYNGESFALDLTPNPSPTPAGLSLINFTDPQPAGPPNSLVQSYEGFNFMSLWRWQGPYNADSNNSLYFTGSTAGSAQFSMPAGTTLVSLNVFSADFSGGTGAVTIVDSSGMNAVVNQSIPADGQLHRVYTLWKQPVVNPVTVTFTDGTVSAWVLGIADIEYQ